MDVPLGSSGIKVHGLVLGRMHMARLMLGSQVMSYGDLLQMGMGVVWMNLLLQWRIRQSVRGDRFTKQGFKKWPFAARIGEGNY